MFWKFKKQKDNSVSFSIDEIMKGQIPNHIAIIMDGNGRWAKKRALPRTAGHHEGMKVVKRVTKLANKLGVHTLTVYAFSTENWKRPREEVNYLLRLPEEFMGTFLPELIEENVQVRIMGNKDAIPAHTLSAVEKAVSETKQNTGLILNFALNYGGRAEIIRAVNQIVIDQNAGKLSAEINDEIFSGYLMSSSLEDPDLLIRTSGEIRLSNFMLWQLAYTEFWFTDVLWPDFREEHLLEAIHAFQKRGRRYGGI
ncbi:isoprenyl transferase [Fredinandcohnia quinoae]|uniref:Isoprenyl transferase n=1 Tax=Fredinandcohnia quinoae TaxID=2918902 RepID=A0AAW5E158_9BACI|nr:isoprenyl transferase [Fredinandcohnia sp. SECRCQ15]MCH1623751.1 isoprenyl transferase [Fredinandcohnia sp. SECRCQ15]